MKPQVLGKTFGNIKIIKVLAPIILSYKTTYIANYLGECIYCGFNVEIHSISLKRSPNKICKECG